MTTTREDNVGKLVVSEFITLDGVVEDPGGAESFEHGGWSFKFEQGPDGEQYKLDEVLAADALLLGRVTYEGFAAVWPAMADEAGFADKMNAMPKYVVSTTLERPEWNNTTVVAGDVPGEVAKLKQEAGDLLVTGSPTLIRTLMEHDLVDQYRLMVFPIVLGTGKRLFGDGAGLSMLRLVEGRPVGPDGVLVLTYERARTADG
jgi:dihydrofolate reductase